MIPEQIRLISQNEYFDYTRAFRNFSTYRQYGLRKVTIGNGSFIHDPNYGFFRLIKDVIIHIFHFTYFDLDIQQKRAILERDVAILNNIHLRLLQLPDQITEPDQYKLFYTAYLATAIANDVLPEQLNWSKPTFTQKVSNKIDEFFGYVPIQNPVINWPSNQKIIGLAALPYQRAWGLFQFLINNGEGLDAGQFRVFLMGISANKDARAIIEYSLALNQYMQRSDKYDVFEDNKKTEFRLLLIEFCMKVISEAKDSHIELMRQTLPIYRALPQNSKISGKIDYGMMLLKLRVHGFNVDQFVDF